MTASIEPLGGEASSALFDELLAAQTGPGGYALLHRPDSGPDGQVEVLAGEMSEVSSLADLPLDAQPPSTGGDAAHELLVVVPFRQVTERGLACSDDGAPLLVMRIARQETVNTAAVLERLPDETLTLRGAGFTVDDAAYADLVRTVLTEDIGSGRGANFVIERPFVAEVADYGPRAALSVFRRLLARERGAYWTFLVHTGERTFVGASPERHVSAVDGEVVMNPISGTYRYPRGGATATGVLDFLQDRKETDELLMVVDEELKMMGRICAGGGRVVGPYLKEMARLAHTEYLIKGHSSWPVQDILRETLLAPTVTGSPLESACQVIKDREPGGRGYYSGVLALVGSDGVGNRLLDSTILIRTADIDAVGRLRMGVGATLVRHSDPDAEVAETHAKAAGFLAAVRGEPATVARIDATAPAAPRFGRLDSDPRVRAALLRRNTALAPFWTDAAPARGQRSRACTGNVLLIDGEDSFTAMLAHQLTALGLAPVIRRWSAFLDARSLSGLEAYDLVIVGPGPGDPRAVHDPKIATLRAVTGHLLVERRPTLSVCLGHQVLAGELGLPLVRKPQPHQGRQRRIDLFGQSLRVGFYNSFAAQAGPGPLNPPRAGGPVEVSRDPVTHEVHGLRGPSFRSVQFHPESVLSVDGVAILHDLVSDLLTPLVAAEIA
ncbi:anthranilate synthase family protein [Streptomyces sp. NPDC046976]|uniref:anthranilate synthase family protein n=1 Tax=Streptomyces sp. NPDC046976 TaxID=3155258 RepID=UPI0033EB6E33